MLNHIGLQLYSIRELMNKDFEDSVRKAAALGFTGVETAGFPGTTPQAARKLFDLLGLKVVGAHTRPPVGDQKNEVIETMATIGCTRVINPSLPRDEIKTMDGIKRACDMMNEAAANAHPHGMTIGIHNHWWEMQKVDGEYVYRLMLKLLDPSIFFEVDTYWVKYAGLDPASVVKELGSRAPLLHLKDGPAESNEQPMVALGTGVMDIPAILAASGNHLEYPIVEFDRCATDIFEALSASVKYLRSL
ncbi:MAG TPA: sugar phosphate isomerase/epimerase [Anaerolineaceae bacterium]